MEHARQFFINGTWVDPSGTNTLPVVNPATEEVIATDRDGWAGRRRRCGGGRAGGVRVLVADVGR